MQTTLTKSDILADETLFQRACEKWVYRNIGQCVSSLMYDIGQNLEECSRIFDFDYDEALGWFVREDYEEPVNDFIDGADLDDLEAIAEEVGYWDDVLAESGVPEIIEVEGEEDMFWEFDGHHFDDEDDAIEAARLSVIDTIREKVKALMYEDEYRDIAYKFDIEPHRDEVYEHWTIPEGWTARDLEQHGQLVFDFGGMRIWCRCTTGQSISLDGCIRQIVRELDEDHWVWGETR